VERPAFAIKELVENSVDARATAITVEIRDGGTSFFRVTDNGDGIRHEDLRMAFARHATSKLRTAEELQAIATLGFRGEALASIAAVSRVRLTTRTRTEDSGSMVVCEGGQILSIEDAASPEGTTIVVEDLFYNVPARRKFLKKPQTEAGQAVDVVLRMILSRPDIAFRFLNNGKQAYHSPGNGDLRTAVFSVLGRETSQGMTVVKGATAGCALVGLIGVGELARTNRTYQCFFLNGRSIRSTLLTQALETGCRERVMVGRYPICALHLTMPFDLVDVNVHPNKLEVRFQDEKAVYDGIAYLIAETFVQEPPAAPSYAFEKPQLCAEAARQLPPISVAVQPAAHRLDAPKPALSLRETRPPVLPASPPKPAESPKAAEQLAMAAESLPEDTQTKLLGVAFDTYVLLQRGQTLYMVDQHAAHERLLYERYNKALPQGGASQQLLPPIILPVTQREMMLIQMHQETMQAVGLTVESFGERSVQIRAVPMVLGVPQIQDFFSALLDTFDTLKELPTVERRRDAIIQLACKKAVKSGDVLSRQEMQTLLDTVAQENLPLTCPHGRPILITLTRQELDKRFRRTV
ncbi:MAG: DNA mismatch repair endonuclease MutL, partial [Clostridia bacterium]